MYNLDEKLAASIHSLKLSSMIEGLILEYDLIYNAELYFACVEKSDSNFKVHKIFPESDKGYIEWFIQERGGIKSSISTILMQSIVLEVGTPFSIESHDGSIFEGDKLVEIVIVPKDKSPENLIKEYPKISEIVMMFNNPVMPSFNNMNT